MTFATSLPSSVSFERDRDEILVSTFGEEFEPFLREIHGDDYFIEAQAVGKAALGLCSGLLDSLTGQVVLLDKAVAFRDNHMRLFERREEVALDDLRGART